MILNVLVLQISMFSLVMTEEQKDHALFYRRGVKAKPKREEMPDKTVEDVLHWLQSRYKQVSRKTREDLSRAYLPSLSNNGLAPRPFQTKKPEVAPTVASTNYETSSNQNGYEQNYEVTSNQPNYRQEYESPTSKQPYRDDLYQTEGYQYNDQQTLQQEQEQQPQGQQPQQPQQQQPQQPAQEEQPPQQQPQEQPQQQQQQDIPTSTDVFNPAPQDHLPHIHALNVDCSRDKMEVDIEFSSPFNGIVYSKGYHNSPECVYVQPNSNEIKYKFTLVENSCGTQFIDGFSQNENSYLENTLVIQNERGILEVWDAVRSVRCLWEGRIDQNIKTGLSIALNQELVTFSGDTGKAKIEIQSGRGPYTSNAPELVQIGDVMTLLVSVEGDDNFQLRVGECKGTDGTNTIDLTDSRGCPLKEKLMAGFQYSRHQQTNAAIAYAYFRAFKFPDVMDLTIECNVQLCKTDCRPICDDPNQKFEPFRRKRSANQTDDFFIRRTIKVYLPQDIAAAEPLRSERDSDICLSRNAFYGSTAALSAVSIVSGLFALLFWTKNQQKEI